MRRRKEPKPCAVPECKRYAKGRGYCNLHYQRVRKYGDPHVVLPKRRNYPAPQPRPGLVRGDTGQGRWDRLVWFCEQERILEPEELGELLMKYTGRDAA